MRTNRAGFLTKVFGIPVIAGETVHLGDVVLQPGGRSFGGSVVFPQEGPSEGAWVVAATGDDLDADRLNESLQERGPNVFLNARVAMVHPDGTFRLDGLEPMTSTP